jgi:hypothetical protein
MNELCIHTAGDRAAGFRDLTCEEVEGVSGGFWSEVLIDLAKGYVRDFVRGTVSAAGQWITDQVQANRESGPNPQYATDAMGGIYAPVNENDH